MKASSHKKQKSMEKPKQQKKQKVQTHGQGLGRGLAGDMGLNFLFFFVFLVFPLFFVCFSCEDTFITVPFKKCAFLQFAHLRPPWVPLLNEKRHRNINSDVVGICDRLVLKLFVRNDKTSEQQRQNAKP